MDFRLFIRKNIFQNVLVVRKNILLYEHPEVHSDINVVVYLFLFYIRIFFGIGGHFSNSAVQYSAKYFQDKDVYFPDKQSFRKSGRINSSSIFRRCDMKMS